MVFEFWAHVDSFSCSRKRKWNSHLNFARRLICQQCWKWFTFNETLTTFYDGNFEVIIIVVNVVMLPVHCAATFRCDLNTLEMNFLAPFYLIRIRDINGAGLHTTKLTWKSWWKFFMIFFFFTSLLLFCGKLGMQSRLYPLKLFQLKWIIADPCRKHTNTSL